MLKLVPIDSVGLPGLAALALGFLAFAIALIAARSRGARDAKSAVVRRSGASIVWIIAQGLGIAIAGFGPIRVALDPMSARALAEGAVVLALMLAAIWLFDAASRTMGRTWALVARTREDHMLVQSGPFAYVRNPIYVALFLFMIALAIGYGHMTNLILAIPIYLAATWLRVAHEERLLRAQFGDAFDAYAARVKRFVPGLI